MKFNSINKIIILISLIFFSCKSKFDTDSNTTLIETSLHDNTSEVKSSEIKTIIEYLLNSKNLTSYGTFHLVAIQKIKDDFGDIDYNFVNFNLDNIKFSQNLSKSSSSRGWGSILYSNEFTENQLTLTNLSTKEKTTYNLYMRDYGILALNVNSDKIKTYTRTDDEGKNGFYNGEVGFLIISDLEYTIDNYNGAIVKLIRADKENIINLLK